VAKSRQSRTHRSDRRVVWTLSRNPEPKLQVSAALRLLLIWLWALEVLTSDLCRVKDGKGLAPAPGQSSEPLNPLVNALLGSSPDPRDRGLVAAFRQLFVNARGSEQHSLSSSAPYKESQLTLPGRVRIGALLLAGPGCRRG
jgi:hypothetical protein